MGLVIMEPLARVKVVRKTDHKSDEKIALRIIEVVCNYYGITRETIFHRFKPKEVTEKKHMILWLMRKHTNLTVEHIGTILGVHYSVVCTGSQNFKRLLDFDDRYETAVKEIEAQIL